MNFINANKEFDFIRLSDRIVCEKVILRLRFSNGFILRNSKAPIRHVPSVNGKKNTEP